MQSRASRRFGCSERVSSFVAPLSLWGCGSLGFIVQGLRTAMAVRDLGVEDLRA